MIKVYTDGGGPCLKKMSAAAFIVRGLNDTPVRLVCTLGKCTTNQAELAAVLIALSFLHKYPETLGSGITWFSDSQYAVRGGAGWVRKWEGNDWRSRKKVPIKNVEFWRAYLKLSKDVNIRPLHLKGHTGQVENELCDRACRWAIHKSGDTLDHFNRSKVLITDVHIKYRNVPYQWKFFRGEPLVESWLQGDLGVDYLKQVFKGVK